MSRHTLYITAFLILSFALTACDSAENKEQQYIAKGDIYLAQGDYTRARLEYRNAARISPTNPQTLYNLGRIDEAQGNIRNALSAFLVAEQQDKDFAPAISKIIRYFMAAEQYQEVEKRIDHLISLEPENADARAIKGSLYLRQKDFKKAKESAQKALELDPSNILAFSVLTGFYNNQDQKDEAIKVLEAGIEKNPKDISLRLLKAAIYSEQDNIAKVSDTYHDIFELYPDDIRFRFDLAEILSQTGNDDKAEALLRSTVKAFPDNLRAKHLLTTFLEENRTISLAEEEIRTYIKETPEEKIPYLWLADLYIRNNKDQLAVETLKNVIRTASDDKISLNANTSLAGIQIRQGDIDFAKKLIGAVLAKDVNNKDALLVRANLAFHQGQYQEAVADLRTILRDHPAEKRASRILAEIFLLQGHIDLAIDTLFQSINASTSADFSLHVRLAQLHALRGNKEEALKLLSNVTKADPTYAIGWENAARLAIEQEKWEDAESYIQKLEKLDGQALLATFLKGQIKEKTGNLEEAATRYKKVIRTAPSAPIAEYALSALLSLSKAPEDIKKAKDFLLSLETDNPSVATVTGGMLVILNEKELAKNMFEKAIANKPKTQAPYLALAQLFEEEGNTNKAIALLKDAEKALPFEPAAPVKRAVLLSSQGRVEDAINIYSALLEQNKNLDFVANNMAQLIADHRYHDKDSMEKAKLIAERFIGSNNLYYLDTLGWVYFRQGLISQAEPLLKRAATEARPAHPQMLYHYGALLAKLDKKNEAKAYLKRAISSDEDYTGKDEARALYEKL